MPDRIGRRRDGGSVVEEFRLQFLSSPSTTWWAGRARARGHPRVPSAGRAWGACQPNDRAGVSHPWRILRTAGPPRPDSSTHYAVLDVPRDADEGEILRAYRRYAKRLHPDVNQDPHAGIQFQHAKAAYEMLRDPVRRFRYDATLAVIETPPVPVIVHHHTFISRRIEDGLIGGFVSLAGIGAVYALALLVVH